MYENVWKCLKMSENVWKCLQMYENIAQYMNMYEKENQENVRKYLQMSANV